MARYNKIYAGPAGQNLPLVTEAACNAALLPGTFVTLSSGKWVAATTDIHAQLRILQDNYLSQCDVDTAVAADETGLGLEIIPGHYYNVRVPTGVNVTRGAPICVGASGKAKLAVSGDFAILYADEAYNNTSGADQLVRCVAATGYYVP